MLTFNEVRKVCFGSNLDDHYLQRIAAFREAYLACGISVTPKVHATLVHVPQYCSKYGALGRYSEQASESVHANFSDQWSRSGKVGLSHPHYATNLLREVVRYNGRRLV